MTGPAKLTSWPLVGRERELQEIGRALGAGSVIVAAPAGVGKSRLARDAIAAEATIGALTGWVQATRSAASIPLGAFAGVLPDDVRADEPLRLMRAGVEALRERARGRRIVLGVDDAQLLDPVSAALVLHLASQDVRILVTLRTGEPVPDAIEALSKDHGARRIELTPLDAPAVAALVEAALDGPADEAAVRWIEQTSRGNPLYVRELIAGAVQAGALTPAGGLWRLVSRPPVSDSLRELIAARLAGLDDAQREPLELLSLCEPLTLGELAALTSGDALAEVDARGLLTLGDGGQVRLAHPLFGEVVGGTLPRLRGRRLRLRLAEALQRRAAPTADDTLRIARLLLDAGGALPSALRVQAARAANLAGDPDLGAELAQGALDDGGLEAVLLLARAHVLRNRNDDAEAVLAASEPKAPGDPQASRYLRQRTWNLTWGLYRRRDAVALLDRALAWSGDPGWIEEVTSMRRRETAVEAGFSAMEDVEPAALSADERRMLDVHAAIAALYAGDGATAVEIARRIRPQLPLRTPGDAAALIVPCAVALETGDGWPEIEGYMLDVLRESVSASDHEAAGTTASMLGGLCFLRGRYRDAALRADEAELHYSRHDTLGALVNLNAMRVGIAAATGDYAAAAASLARIASLLGGREPHPSQVAFILRARGWDARLRSDAEAVESFLAAAEQMADAPLFAAQLTYEALRCGAAVAPRLRGLVARCTAPLADAYLAHAEARERDDGAALLAAADAFAAIGADRYALEAAAESAAAFLREGRRDSATRAAQRARELHAPDQGTEPPVIDGLGRPAVELTRREEQIVGLARRGLSNAEIAELLTVSIRTVEVHMYRAMIKLDVRDRRDL